MRSGNTPDMNMTKEMRELAERLAGMGWTVTHNKHWRCVPPDKGAPVLFFATSPSDHRAYDNVKALLKRHGYRI